MGKRRAENPDLLAIKSEKHKKRKDYALPDDEGAPEFPSHFDERHQAKFREVCEYLKMLGILGKTSRDSIASYCDLWIQYVDASMHVQEHGAFFDMEDRQGNVFSKECAESLKIKNIANAILRYQIEFCFTPQSKFSIAKVRAETAKAERSKGATFFSGRKAATSEPKNGTS